MSRDIFQIVLFSLIILSISIVVTGSFQENCYQKALDEYNEGDYSTAKTNIDDAIQLDSSNIEYLTLKEMILRKSGDLQSADTIQNLILTLQKQDEIHHTYLEKMKLFYEFKHMGMNAFKKMEWRNAEKYLQKAYEIFQDDVELNIVLEYIQKKGYLNSDYYITDNYGNLWNIKESGKVINEALQLPGGYTPDQTPQKNNRDNSDGMVEPSNINPQKSSSMNQNYSNSQSNIPVKTRSRTINAESEEEYDRTEDGEPYGSIPPDFDDYDDSDIDPLCIELNDKGVEFYENKEYDAALHQFELSLTNCADYLLPYYNKAYCYNKQGRYKESIELHAHILDIETEIQKNLGRNSNRMTILYNNLGYAQYMYYLASKNCNYLDNSLDSFKKAEEYVRSGFQSGLDNSDTIIRNNNKIVEQKSKVDCLDFNYKDNYSKESPNLQNIISFIFNCVLIPVNFIISLLLNNLVVFLCSIVIICVLLAESNKGGG